MRTNVNRTLPLNEVPKYTYKLQSVKDPITYRPFLVKEEKVMLMAIESDKEEDMQQAITEAYYTLENALRSGDQYTITSAATDVRDLLGSKLK